jgi:hypothetical protein
VEDKISNTLARYHTSKGLLESSDTDVFLADADRNMIDASLACVPTMKENTKGTKPYWSKHLTYLSKFPKQAFVQWKSDGRPRNPHSFSWQNHKEAKRLFRKAQRNAEKTYQAKNIADLTEMETVDQRFCWYLVNKSRKLSTPKVQPIRDSDGTLVYDPDQISKSWSTYFQMLHQPQNGSNYDEPHADLVSEAVRECQNVHEALYCLQL